MSYMKQAVRAGWVSLVMVGVLLILGVSIYWCTTPLLDTYHSYSAGVMLDRKHIPVYISQNTKEQYSMQLETYPEPLRRMVLEKEDQYFYYHLGINPFSMVRAVMHGLTGNGYGGSSTITQQLVKILLGNEQERTVLHKLQESLLAIALEIRCSKDTILTMYLNSVPLGNQSQGFGMASWVYFGRSIETISDSELIQLTATLSSPATQNPWVPGNTDVRTALAAKLGTYLSIATTTSNGYQFNSQAAFEVQPLLNDNCEQQCLTTIDSDLTSDLRGLLREHLDATTDRGGTHGAIVVIQVPQNKVLAVVGSPDPYAARRDGNQLKV